jgi:hypothetical protein
MFESSGAINILLLRSTKLAFYLLISTLNYSYIKAPSLLQESLLNFKSRNILPPSLAPLSEGESS